MDIGVVIHIICLIIWSFILIKDIRACRDAEAAAKIAYEEHKSCGEKIEDMESAMQEYEEQCRETKESIIEATGTLAIHEKIKEVAASGGGAVMFVINTSGTDGGLFGGMGEEGDTIPPPLDEDDIDDAWKNL